MKLLASVALIAGLAVFLPAASQAQVRVQVEFGRRHYVPSYRYDRFHGAGWYSGYSRYGSYPAEIVIVRRPFRPAPIIVFTSRRHRFHRHW